MNDYPLARAVTCRSTIWTCSTWPGATRMRWLEAASR